MTTSIVSSDTSVEDRRAIGERARENTPIATQADWERGRAARPSGAADRAERHARG